MSVIRDESRKLGPMKSSLHQPVGEFGRDRLATKSEIADLLRVTPRTIEVMMSDGRVPFIRFGRTVRFIVADVLAAGSKTTTTREH